MDCAKKNIVKSFLFFLGSRKSRLPLFPVSCFWRLQNQTKKARWSLYKSRFMFPWIYGVSPSFCVRLFPLPFWLVFFGGDPTKNNINGRSQEYPKASPGRPGQRTLPNKPRPKPWFDQRWEIGVDIYVYIYIYMYAYVYLKTYMIYVYIYISIYIYIYIFIYIYTVRHIKIVVWC